MEYHIIEELELEIERLRKELTKHIHMWRIIHMCDMRSEKILELTAERDEARREVLLWVKERCSLAELSDEIKKRGWGYLKEDGK